MGWENYTHFVIQNPGKPQYTQAKTGHEAGSLTARSGLLAPKTAEKRESSFARRPGVLPGGALQLLK